MMAEGVPIIVGAKQPVKRLDDGSIEVPGITGNILALVSQYLDFKFDVVPPPDGKWGNPNPNGSWNGMIGMVTRSEVEFAIGPFSVNPERNQAIQFSVPILYDENVVLTPRPKLQSDMIGFLKPFPLQVWLLIVGSLIITALALICMQILEGKIYNFTTTNVTSKSIIWALKVITTEGSEWLPITNASRSIVAMWLMSTLVIVSAYSGILIAMLTLPKVTIPIDSLYDLVHQSSVPWRLLANTAVTRSFETSEDEVRRLAYDNNHGYIDDCYTQRSLVVSGGFATICQTLRVRQIIKWDYKTNGKCRVYIAREIVQWDMLAFAFRRGSPYIRRANKVIRGIMESGIYGKLVNAQFPSTDQCPRSPTHDKDGGINPLDIKSLGGCFLLLVGGLGLSLLVFLLEMTCAYPFARSTVPSAHSPMKVPHFGGLDES